MIVLILLIIGAISSFVYLFLVSAKSETDLLAEEVQNILIKHGEVMPLQELRPIVINSIKYVKETDDLEKVPLKISWDATRQIVKDGIELSCLTRISPMVAMAAVYYQKKEAMGVHKGPR